MEADLAQASQVLMSRVGCCRMNKNKSFLGVGLLWNTRSCLSPFQMDQSQYCLFRPVGPFQRVRVCLLHHLPVENFYLGGWGGGVNLEPPACQDRCSTSAVVFSEGPLPCPFYPRQPSLPHSPFVKESSSHLAVVCNFVA